MGESSQISFCTPSTSTRKMRMKTGIGVKSSGIPDRATMERIRDCHLTERISLQDLGKRFGLSSGSRTLRSWLRRTFGPDWRKGAGQ